MFKKINKVFKKNKKSNQVDWSVVKYKWSKIIKQDNNNIEAWVQFISAELNLADFSSAIKHAKEAQHIFPNHNIFNKLEARSLMGTKDYKQAKEVYNSILEFDKEDNESLLQLSLISLHHEDYLEAIKYANKVPEEKQSIAYIARAYVRSGDTSAAIPYWEQLYTIDQYKQEACIQLASIYVNSKMFDKSIDILTETSLQFPKNITLLQLKGKALAALSQYDESINTYKKILEIKENHIDTLLSLAQLYLLQSSWDKAQYYVDLILRLDNNNVKAMVFDARIAKQLI